jgi:hypothetical protein
VKINPLKASAIFQVPANTSKGQIAMRRDIPVSDIIRELQKLPTTAKIVVDTIKEVQVVGIVVKRTDNSTKQIADIIVPKDK